MTAKLRLDLPLVLPDVDDERDRCVRRLVDDLEAREGVARAHVVTSDERGEEPAELCVHYDPNQLELGRVRQIVERDGARLTSRFGHLLWEVDGIDHARRARMVSERLARLDGVVEAQASATGRLRIEYDQERSGEDEIRRLLEGLGVRVSGSARPELPIDADEGHAHDEPGHDHDHSHEGHDHGDGGGHHHHAHGGIFAVFGERTEMVFAGLAGVAVLTGFLLETLTGVDDGVPLGLFLAAYFFGGSMTLREAYESVRSGRFEIDFLMLIAAAGAAALGKFFEGALLLFLFSLGHSLEHYAMGRAKKAIEALAELAPKTAVVRRDGQQEEVPVDALRVGDVVIVRPDARIPADGFVIVGESSVDQAPITGESVPVDKRPVAERDAAAAAPDTVDADSRLFAGTINGKGALELHVTKRAQDNTLARVVQMVSEAETQKSPTQRFTDRFERFFVPAVIALDVILLASPLVTGEAYGDAFYRAMAVLVAASPCALAIATPSAVLSAVARAGRSGVLVKGGAPLEALGVLRAIAFDKTGTVTEGKPRLTDVVATGGDERRLLRTAVAVERLSDHPLAAAIVRDAKDRVEGDAPEAEGLESVTGRGLRARLDGTQVLVGKAELFDEADGNPLPEDVRGEVERLEGAGRTTMIVRQGDDYLGVLGLMDTPRAAAPEVVSRLRKIGVRRMIMISGDNQRVADAVAGEVGLDEAWGDLMPDDKVASIKKLRAQEGKAAMVGDGVNDAPAMATATVGIAMGAAGSDVALETADVALMADDLSRLPFAVGLSRSTSRIIKQNLYASLGVVVLLVPATLLGLGIGPAVLVHEGSTLIVVANALRLLGYKE